MISYTLIRLFVLGLVLVSALYFLNKKYNAPTRVVDNAQATIYIGQDEIRFDYPIFNNYDASITDGPTIQLVYTPKSRLMILLSSNTIDWIIVNFLVAPTWEQKNKHGVGYKVNGFSVSFDDSVGGAYMASVNRIDSAPWALPTNIVIDTIADSFVVSKNKKTDMSISTQQKF